MWEFRITTASALDMMNVFYITGVLTFVFHGLSCAAVAQFAAVVGWYIVHKPRGVDLLAVPLTHWALAAVLLGAGQVMNLL